MTRHRKPRRPKSQALTLPELLIALAVTMLIGAAVAAMMVSTSYGVSNERDLRAMVVKQRSLKGRLDAAVTSSKKVLAQGDGCLVLWMSDTRDNGLPDLSELRRIERDAATGQMMSYTAPEAMPASADVSYPLTTDFAQLTDELRGGASLPAQTWGGGVRAWSITLNHDDPRSATLVSYTLTLSEGELTEQVIGAAAVGTAELAGE